MKNMSIDWVLKRKLRNNHYSFNTIAINFCPTPVFVSKINSLTLVAYCNWLRACPNRLVPLDPLPGVFLYTWCRFGTAYTPAWRCNPRPSEHSRHVPRPEFRQEAVPSLPIKRGLVIARDSGQIREP
jgi:hypothetical protein